MFGDPQNLSLVTPDGGHQGSPKKKSWTIHVPAARVTVESENPFGHPMLPEIVPGSIDVQAYSQLGIPGERHEGFDEDASY